MPDRRQPSTGVPTHAGKHVETSCSHLVGFAAGPPEPEHAVGNPGQRCSPGSTGLCRAATQEFCKRLYGHCFCNRHRTHHRLDRRESDWTTVVVSVLRGLLGAGSHTKHRAGQVLFRVGGRRAPSATPRSRGHRRCPPRPHASGAGAADGPLRRRVPSTAYGSQRQPSRWSGSRTGWPPALRWGGRCGGPRPDRQPGSDSTSRHPLPRPIAGGEDGSEVCAHDRASPAPVDHTLRSAASRGRGARVGRTRHSSSSSSIWSTGAPAGPAATCSAPELWSPATSPTCSAPAATCSTPDPGLPSTKSRTGQCSRRARPRPGRAGVR